MPDYLGNGAFHIFLNLEHEVGARFKSYSEMAKRWDVSKDLGRYAVSLGFIGVMSLHTFLLKRIVSNMSAPNIFARFLFQVQLFSYTYYYMLVSATRNVDALFWAMLVTVNANYILRNTQMYDRCFDWVCTKYLSVYSRLSRSIFKVAKRVVNQSRIHRARTLILGSEPLPRTASFDDGKDLPSESILKLMFQIKKADQDSLADATALIAVPVLITALTSFDVLFEGSDILRKLYRRVTSSSVSAGNTAALIAAISIAPNATSAVVTSSSSSLNLGILGALRHYVSCPAY